jgi:hypothetical protein
MADKWTPWKTKMTRAKKKGPEAVVKCYEDFIVFCDEEGWPDWWAMMETSAMDAEWELQSKGGW